METPVHADIHLLMVTESSLSTTLEHEGYKSVGINAHVAPAFNDVKKILGKQHIDVLLIDWEYAHLNPFEIIRYIRSSPEHKNLPIIVSSVHVCDDKIANFKDIDLFVKQPVPRVLILERIKRLLNKKNRSDERISWNDLYLGSVNVQVENREYEMILADVSMSGIFLYSEENLEVGQTVTLDFNLPGIKELLRMQGEVVRITRMHKINDKMNKGIGIKFTKFIDETEMNLESFMKKNRPESNFMHYYL